MTNEMKDRDARRRWGAMASAVVAVAVVVAGVLYVGERSAWFGLGTPAEAPGERVFELAVEDGHLAGGQPNVLRVTEGDRVRIRWRSNTPLSLHLHGYDIEVEVKPGTVAEIAFTAYASGRFPINVHADEGASEAHQEAALAYVEVRPR